MTTRSTTCIRSPSQSGNKVEQGNGNPELNPCICISSIDPVVEQGVSGIVDCLNDGNTAYISRLSREGEGEYTPASTEKTDRGRSGYTSSRDVTATGSTQGVASRQAEQADYGGENVENIRYLKGFNSNDTSEAVEQVCGDTADRTEIFSKGLTGQETDLNVNVLNPVLHTFTSEERAIVNVYDSCRMGTCSCDYQLSGEILQLKPCRFAYLVSLGTAECKRAYEPLVSNVTDGFRVVDDNMDLTDMKYECENYTSVYTPENKKKLDSIISKELSEGYLKIVNNKPTCIHSMGAVPKPDGGIRPITDCSMPRDISVNNCCADIIQDLSLGLPWKKPPGLKNPKVFRVLHFLGQGHPTIPGVQVSRFGHRFHKNGNQAPKRQIGEIDKSTQKICGEKYNFKKRAGEFGGSFGSLLPCGGWR